MKLIDFRVDNNELSVTNTHSDYTGRLVLYLKQNSLEIDYLDFKDDEIIFLNVLDTILHLEEDIVIFHVTKYNKFLIQDCLSELNNSDISVQIILIGMYTSNHYEEFFIHEKLKLYVFQFLQEHHIKTLVKTDIEKRNRINGLIYKVEGKIYVIFFNKTDNLYTNTINLSPYISHIISPSCVLTDGYFFFTWM